MAEEKPVSSAFAKPPRMAGRFRESYEQSEAAQVAGVQPEQQQQLQQQMDQPYQAPVAPQPMQFVPPQAQPVQQEAPQQTAYDAALTERLLAERNELAKQLQEERQAREQMLAERQAAELAAAQEKFLAEATASPDLEDLETVTGDDARKIVAATAAAMSKPLQDMRTQLAQQQQQQQQAYRQLQQEKKAQAVLAEHPDFFDLYKNPQFVAFMKGREGLSSRSREEVAFEEYERGNTAYVNDLISRYKKGAPNAGAVAGVAPVQVAGASSYVPPRQSAAPQVNFTLRELNDLFQMRRISHDQYREMLKQYRAANSQ